MALIKCKECGKEISDKATSCPDCGCPVKVEKSNDWLKWVLIIVVVLLVFALVFILGKPKNNDKPVQTNDDSQEEVVQQPEPVKDPFVISDENGYVADQYGYWYDITGTLTNTTDINYTYVQVNYVLYDASGATLTTWMTNTTYLEANGVWKYHLHIPVPNEGAQNVASYKFINYKYNY